MTKISEHFALYEVYIVVRIFQSVLAMLFNSLTLLCVVKYKKLRSTASILVSSIALSDFLHALATVVRLLLKFVLLEWSVESKLCITGIVLEAITIMAQLGSFMLLGMERRNSLLARLNRTKKWSPKKVTVLVIVFWLILILWNVTEGILDVKYPKEKTWCAVYHFFNIYFAYIPLVTFLVATIACLASYGHIAWIVRMSNHRVAAAETISQQNQMKRDLRITKMMAMVVGVYFVLYIPFFCIAFNMSRDSPLWYHVIFYLSVLIYDVNFWVNPIIYAWGDLNFRKAFNNLLSGCFGGCPKRQAEPSNYGLSQNDMDSRRIGPERKVYTIENKMILNVPGPRVNRRI